MVEAGWRIGAATSALVLLAAPAQAEEPSDATRARAAELGREGAAASKARQWDTCIQAYTAAVALEDAPVVSGELGLCEEQAGRFADAYRHLNHALDAAPAQKKDEPWKRYRAAVSRVTERVALLFLTVTPTSALVVLDGRPLGRADGRYLPLDPGKHTVTARLKGYKDATQALTVNARDLPVVHLTLAAIPEVAQHRDPPPKPMVPTARVSPTAPDMAPTAWYVPAWSPRGVLVSLAYFSAGTAVVSGATAIGLEVDRGSLRSGLTPSSCGPDAAPRPGACDALAERYDQRNVALGTAIGSFVASGLFAGAARLVHGLERHAAHMKVAPTAAGSGGGIVVLGTW